MKGKQKRAYGTPDSHVVPHRSTDEACSGLTAQFGRDTVRFTEYGRRQTHRLFILYLYSCSTDCLVLYRSTSNTFTGSIHSTVLFEY